MKFNAGFAVLVAISNLVVGAPGALASDEAVAYTQIISCKLVSKTAEVPNELGLLASDPEFSGPSKAILTMKMKNVHVPGVVMNLAFIMDVSVDGTKVEGSVAKEPKFSFDKSDLNKNMFERGPKFRASFSISSTESAKYSCDATAKMQ